MSAFKSPYLNVFPHITHTHTHTHIYIYIYMLILLTFLRTWKWLKIGRNVVFYPWFSLCYSIKTWNLQFMGFPEQLLQLRIFTIWMAQNDFHRHFNHNWIKLELNCQLKINFPLRFRHVRILFVSLFFNNTWGEQSVSAKRYVILFILSVCFISGCSGFYYHLENLKFSCEHLTVRTSTKSVRWLEKDCNWSSTINKTVEGKTN